MLSFLRDVTRSDSTIFPAFIIILYAADFNYLIRWVIVNYILLTISIANSHATSAYECELLAVTWHYLPSADASTTWQVIRLSRRARDRGNGAYITALLPLQVNTASRILSVLNSLLHFYSGVKDKSFARDVSPAAPLIYMGWWIVRLGCQTIASSRTCPRAEKPAAYFKYWGNVIAKLCAPYTISV